MKKLICIALTLLAVLTVVTLSTVKAEEVLSDELIDNSSFITNVDGGVAAIDTLEAFAGGDWGANHVFLAEDPVTDVAIRMDYSPAADNMWLMVPVTTEVGDVVKVSMDYYITGTCINFGLGFWCTTKNARLLEHVVAGAPTEGWVHTEWEYEAAAEALAYDSIHAWCVGQSEGSFCYYKNLSVTVNGGENLVVFGDLTQYAETVANGPVKANTIDGLSAGDWSADGHITVCTDPIKDVTIRLDYMEGRDNFFFFVPVTTEVGDVVKVSLDYMVTGTCVNFGLGFWCTSNNSRILEHVFAGAPTEGWVHAEWEYPAETAALAYDSIHCWCVGQSEGSKAYLKNIKVTVGEGENLVTTKDLNALKEYLVSDSAILGAEADEYGNTGSNARYTGSSVVIENGYFAHAVNLAAGKYQVNVEASSEATLKFYKGTDVVATFTTGGTTNDVTLESEADKVVIESTAALEVNKLSVKAYQTVSTSFEGWYASKTTTVNGDFEAFEEGTVLTEEQLEGAWGSVSLDAPGKIVTVDGSKCVQIGTDATHQYSSFFLMLPDTLEVGDVLRVSYDVKLILESEAGSILLNSCFVGGSNVSYYEIPVNAIGQAGFNGSFKTVGKEKVNYPVKITALENGWYNLTIEIELTSNDLIQTNSIRWLLSSTNNNDKMCIDNVNIYYLTEEEPSTDVEATGVTIAEGVSKTLAAGESFTLTATVAPENATNKTVTYTSSNPEVATVDANGKVTAVKKGACSITVTTANGKTAEIAIVVTEATTPDNPTPEKGCKKSIVASFGMIAAIGAIAIVAKKKKENE